jgi:AcrR family transcriptional regulator
VCGGEPPGLRRPRLIGSTLLADQLVSPSRSANIGGVSIDVVVSADPASLEARIVSVASELFGEHGVSGTSLQMIADAAGSAKAAVYYYFKTKNDIIRAVYAEPLAEIEAAVAAAEQVAETASRQAALQVLIPRMAALSVRKRQVFSMIHVDPAIVSFIGKDEAYRGLLKRLDRLLSGPSPDAADRVRASIIGAALYGTVIQPGVAALDDDALVSQLTSILLELVEPIAD